MRNVSFWGRMPKGVLVRIGGNFLTNDKGGKFGRNFGNYLHVGGDPKGLPVGFDCFCNRQIDGQSSKSHFVRLFADLS